LGAGVHIRSPERRLVVHRELSPQRSSELEAVVGHESEIIVEEKTPEANGPAASQSTSGCSVHEELPEIDCQVTPKVAHILLFYLLKINNEITKAF